MPTLVKQLRGIGGCTQPVRLDGHRVEHAVDARTGEIGRVLRRLDSASLPAGNLLVPCKNRRATRCPACAETYRRDTFHLITAGLRGGKGTPDTVTRHPKVFATFTAPGFGAVHNRPTDRRGAVRTCRCGLLHDAADDSLGTPLDPTTYDYEGAVLWARVLGPILDSRAHTFVFGEQLDVRPIRSADFDGTSELTERAVASYIAKYATKGAEATTGALDRPLKFLAELALLDLSDHARRMVRTAWKLGAIKELGHLRLRAWAHMLGFRGHFSTKTRRYSTTLGALRNARAEWRRAQASPDVVGETETPLVLSHWVFAGTGLSAAEAWLATTLAPAPGTEGEPTHD
jgi:hypothetical protein